MRKQLPAAAPLLLFWAVYLCVAASNDSVNKWTPFIPRTWDEVALVDFELPLPVASASPRYVSSDYYYRIPVRPVFKTYPIYHPSKEPAEYMGWLKNQQPQDIFDTSKLITQDDWIRAGEIVFQAPIEFVGSEETLFSLVRDEKWFRENGVLCTKEGIFPNMRYVVREKGKVEIGILACAQCHSRVMPDGTTILGAQGNFPDDRTFGYESRITAQRSGDPAKELTSLRKFMQGSYSTPWITDDVNARFETMSLDEIAAVLEAIPPGTCARQGSSPFYPAHIPDLIGLKERRYFDASGRVQHRSIGDLMRYAALNQGMDVLSSYGGYRPEGELPDPSELSRYSDEQLYALALYVYSLKPPVNPNPFNELAQRGKTVYREAGCNLCHPPPLYTNNRLVPAQGFEVPSSHLQKYDLINVSIDADPIATLKTRRGSGYYKVPSLLGVWYRGPFEHNGSIATLEDWFNPRRLQEDYVPTGFRGYAVKSRPIKAHPFGLSLPEEDRKALIAFLRTL